MNGRLKTAQAERDNKLTTKMASIPKVVEQLIALPALALLLVFAIVGLDAVTADDPMVANCVFGAGRCFVNENGSVSETSTN